MGWGCCLHILTSIRILRYTPNLLYTSVCPLLGSWNEFAGTLMEAPLDGYVTKAAYR
jgi:hypothetical protein